MSRERNESDVAKFSLAMLSLVAVLIIAGIVAVYFSVQRAREAGRAAQQQALP